jgi:hypothetical protein
VRAVRESAAHEARSAAAGAVMSAAAHVAEDEKSSLAFLTSWERGKNDVNTGGDVDDRRLARQIRRQLAEAFGSDGAETVGYACWAVSVTAEVLVVWDLVRANGPFTATHRSFLMKPWLAVFDLPNVVA